VICAGSQGDPVGPTAGSPCDSSWVSGIYIYKNFIKVSGA